MKEEMGPQNPLARQEGLVVRELPEEVLVYDLERAKAHCLNRTAALVWKQCDGRTSVRQMARLVGERLGAEVEEKLVWFALGQLSKDHLLEARVIPPATMAGMSRREMVRSLGLAAAVALPVVTSIIAPTPAQAVSCLHDGDPCSSPAQCCAGVCTGGACVGG